MASAQRRKGRIQLRHPTRSRRAGAAILARSTALALAAASLASLALAARADAFIWWANEAPVPGTIGRANDDGTGVDQSFITTGVKVPAGVASDGTYVYWANTGTNSIGRAFANGAESNPKFITGASLPEGVAVDANHIYWANADGTIGRANLDGTGVDQSFINTGAGDLNLEGVASDGEHLYWANQGANTIGLYNINGGGKFPNLITGAKAPVGVAVDNDPPTDQHVYWVNSTTDTIGRANLDGSGVKQSFKDVGTDTNPRWVAVDDPDVYWTGAGAIGTVTVFGTMINSIFITGVHDPAGIAVDPALGGAPPPSSPQCGETITTDTTLHRNLTNCPNNGIVIGADNVTLDLNYHTIDGDGTPNAGCNPQSGPCDVGVDIEGHDGVTVVNGSVRQFGDGVIVQTTRHTRLLDVSSSKNQFSAIVVTDSTRGQVRNSSGNGSFSSVGQGLFLTFSHQLRIVHNSFRDNAETGIGVFESTHNLFKRNRTSHNHGFAGIDLDGHRNRVTRNRSTRAGEVGILVLGNHNIIARNRASHLRQPGRGEGVAIELEGGDGNVIARNSLRDTEGDAIRMGFGRAVGNEVRFNRIRGAGEDGVHVDAKAGHTLLRRNKVRHSRDDGIDVDSRRTKLSRNRALRNGDLGIEAVRGVNDGGGNKARGNGDPRQCTHVVCN